MAKWLRKVFQKKVIPTDRTIDMTRLYWGHNLSLSRIVDSNMEFAIWNPTAPAVGDDIIWKADPGQVRGQIIEVKSAPNVWDMYFITVTNIRLDNG